MANFRQILGNAVDVVGTKFKLPELGISEKLANGNTMNTAIVQAPSNAKGNFLNTGNGQFSTINYNPSVSGQSGGVALTAPQANYTGQPQDQILSQLKGAYSVARQGIESQNQTLDSSYELTKNDIQNESDLVQKQGEQQRQSQDLLFGDILKNQLQTKQELDRQRMGTFSSLGTLDSSEFQNQQARGDQTFLDQKTRTEKEKAGVIKSIDDQVNAYVEKGRSQLAQLAIQYQSGKNAITQALAQNNLNEAGAIQSALDQIAQRAQEIQNTLINFTNQVGLLKAQGVDVRTNLAGTSGQPYAQEMNQILANQLMQGKSLYTLPTTSINGQGYIANNQKKQDQSPFLQILGQ